MTHIKIHVNPIKKEAYYLIEGGYDEVIQFEIENLKELNKLMKQIHDKLGWNADYKPPTNSSEAQRIDEKPTTNEFVINVPMELVPEIMKLKERIRFPVLWYYSTQPVMKVKEFLETCAEKGLSLRATWLPSAGGDFTKILVNSDKMFREVDKVDGEKRWTLTDVGKIKILNEIKKMKEKQNQES